MSNTATNSGKSDILGWMLFAVIALATTNASASDGGTTAFVHASLIPMTIETVLPDQTVIVQGGRITACGPSDRVAVPVGARIINCQHAFLMPGLADMHMHLSRDWNGDAWPVSPFKLYLSHGVTTIRCFGPRGKTGRYGLTWRKRIAAGKLIGPTIITCGPQLRGHFREDPELIVIRQKYQGFDFIKIYSYVTGQEYRSIVATAKKLGMYTAGHIPFQVGLEGVLDAGMDEIAHIEELMWESSGFDRNRYFKSEDAWMDYVIRETFGDLSALLQLPVGEQDRRLRAMAAELVGKLNGRSIPFCTTLVIDDLIVQKLHEPERFLARPENRYLPARYLEVFRQGREKHQRQFKGGEVFADVKYRIDKLLLKALKANTIPLLLSTDAGTGWMGAVPGLSIHDELGILAGNGFTPYEALAAGTVVASRIVERMNGRDEFGTIVPGKRADLVLLEKSPLEDVSNARRIIGVMAAGRWYDRSAIASMLK